MSIQIVIGKPGTGKSYHVVRYLEKYLTTLSRKKRIGRRIYTNLSLNLKEFQDHFDRLHVPIEIDDVIVLLDQKDLTFDESLLAPGDAREVRRGNKLTLEINPTSQAFFWNRFPDNALIVIDEIQKYLSSVKDVGEAEEQSLIEYFSLHRHKKHDWIFITQSLLSLSVNVRRVSEKVTETLNSKALTLPFPFSIPMSDIQTLLLGFGVQNQVYRVREGRLDGTYKVIYDGPIEVVTMSQEIFKLYKTHTLIGDEGEDNIVTDSEVPFELGKGASRRACFWFLRKHGFHLSVKAGILVFIFFGIHTFFARMSDGSLFEDPSSAIVSKIDPGAVPRKVVSSNKGGYLLPKNQNSNIMGESKDTIAPIDKIKVINDKLCINGVDYHAGDIVNGSRIVSISARYGVQYEKPEDVYIRDYDFIDRCRRWLRFVKNARSADEATGDIFD